MSYSQNLTLGHVAYEGYHALDELDEYTPWDKLSEEEQQRWAQAARNACDVWTWPGGVSEEPMNTNTRNSHAALRAERRKQRGTP